MRGPQAGGQVAPQRLASVLTTQLRVGCPCCAQPNTTLDLSRPSCRAAPVPCAAGEGPGQPPQTERPNLALQERPVPSPAPQRETLPSPTPPAPASPGHLKPLSCLFSRPSAVLGLLQT